MTDSKTQFLPYAKASSIWADTAENYWARGGQSRNPVLRRELCHLQIPKEAVRIFARTPRPPETRHRLRPFAAEDAQGRSPVWHPCRQQIILRMTVRKCW